MRWCGFWGRTAPSQITRYAVQLHETPTSQARLDGPARESAAGLFGQEGGGGADRVSCGPGAHSRAGPTCSYGLRCVLLSAPRAGADRAGTERPGGRHRQRGGFRNPGDRDSQPQSAPGLRFPSRDVSGPIQATGSRGEPETGRDSHHQSAECRDGILEPSILDRPQGD